MSDKKCKCVVLINSSGTGCRFDDKIPKQYHSVNEKPIILHCIEKFQSNENVDAIFCICEEMYFDYIDKLCCSNNITKFVKCISGGDSANESRYNGLKGIEKYVEANDIVLMHDSVRLFTKQKTIDEVVDTAIKNKCAVCGQTINANIFISNADFVFDGNIPSNNVFINSMPFACQYEILKQAFEDAKKYNDINSSAGPMGIVAKYTTIKKFNKIEIDFLETMKITYKEDLKFIKKNYENINAL